MDHGLDLAAAENAAAPLRERFQRAGHRLYLVGGIVRDAWLGRSRDDNDVDLTTDARPPAIKRLLGGVADDVWNQGERFGTIGCRIGEQIFEITTHRADAYEPGSRRPAVAFGDRIEEDLRRRDFTVNAMAVDLADGRLVDPHGGRSDLGSRTLRTPLDPDISLSEDPLRMLRAARFIAALDLAPVPELVVSASRLVERLSIVSTERISDELDKLLLLPEPAAGLRFLAETGLWAQVLPTIPTTEAERLGGRVAAVDDRRAERWAALVLDHGPDAISGLRLSNALRAEVDWLVRVASEADAGSEPSDRHLRELGRTGRGGEPLERALRFARDVVVGDPARRAAMDRLVDGAAALRKIEPDFDDPALPLDGADVIELLGLEPGPDVGRALEILLRHRLEQGPLDADQAVRVLRREWPGGSDPA